MRPSSHPVRVAWLTRVVCATLYLAVHGCTTANGGAVELSWSLRPASGAHTDFIECDSGLPGTAPVTQVRLDWQVGDVHQFTQWNCTDYHGVTGFDLPAGEALVWASPLCNGVLAASDTFTAPAPEQRTVIVGDIVSLNAVELVLEVTSCDQQPCICRDHRTMARSLP